MNKSGKFLAILAAGVMLWGGYGCKNHLEYVEDIKTEYRKTELDPLYTVQTASTTPTESVVAFKVEKHQQIANEVIQIKTVTELYTPYQGWRELYEVPTGIVLFPVAIVSHVFCACTFAMFPFRYAVGLTNFSFACMNPALNAEMRSRAESALVEVVESKVGTTTESNTVPAVRQPVTLRSSVNTWEVLTDDKGEAEFQFLGLNEGSKMLTDGDREIGVYVGKSTEPQLKLIISRDLLRRLEKGHECIVAYRRAPGGKELADCIAKLEELKFVKLAYQLEKSEVETHKDNPEFLAAFKSN